MIFAPTKLSGAWIIDLDRRDDERGFFARTWCEDEFAERGLASLVRQCNISFNHQAGTLRGMHYQDDPHGEAKVVRCTQGAIYDVIIDLRRPSPTFKQWFAMELTARNRRALYIPEGFAHGLQTLQDNSEVSYLMSERHHPEFARGVRWDDPTFNVEWPFCQRRLISERDKSFPDFQ